MSLFGIKASNYQEWKDQPKIGPTLTMESIMESIQNIVDNEEAMKRNAAVENKFWRNFFAEKLKRWDYEQTKYEINMKK